MFAEVFVHDVLSDDEAARKRVLSIIKQIQVRVRAAVACLGLVEFVVFY